MIQHRAMKEEHKSSIPSEQRYSSSIQETVLFPHDNIYSHSYQEALNRYVKHMYICNLLNIKSKETNISKVLRVFKYLVLKSDNRYIFIIITFCQ